MLPVLIPLGRNGASVQRRYITSGNFDFCMDDAQRVTLLTRDSNVWQNIEAGTRIVMRVIFEGLSSLSATYECHLCGARNKLILLGKSSGWLTDSSLNWFVLCIRWWKSISHGKVMRAKQDSRSRLIETGRSKAGTTVLTRKLVTAYATSVSRNPCVSVSSSIVILWRANIICYMWND